MLTAHIKCDYFYYSLSCTHVNSISLTYLLAKEALLQNCHRKEIVNNSPGWILAEKIVQRNLIA